MENKKVFVTRMLPEPALATVQEMFEADIWDKELPPSRDELLSRIEGVDGLLCLLTDKIDGVVMDAAGPGLKVISNCAVGVDNIDLIEATRRGIPVGNTPGILTDTTADFAFALLMASARRVVEGDSYVREGNWKTWGLTLLMGSDIAGACLGIVGFGRIGQAMAKRAQGFGMEVLFYDPSQRESLEAERLGARYVELDDLLGKADFVSLHTPLTVETRHLIEARELELMKNDAILINTARGGVVDPAALYEALKTGKIGGAALDVTEPEPIPMDDPLLELDNLILAPHIASASRATRGKMAEMAVENLAAGLAGERLPNCINPEVYGL